MDKKSLKELEIKTECLVAMMKAEIIGGVLLNSQHNFAWLTAGGNNGVDLCQANGICSLLIRDDGERFLLANHFAMSRLLKEKVS